MAVPLWPPRHIANGRPPHRGSSGPQSRLATLRRTLDEGTSKERLGAPLRDAPSCCVRASSPMSRRPSGGSSDGAAVSLRGEDPLLPTGRFGQ
eukprot:6835517-Alexandrium_andersonii.AAC.1